MKKLILAGLTTGVMMLGMVGMASATTINFEDLGVAPGTQMNVPWNASITSGGFNFAPGPSSVIPDLHVGNNNWITIGSGTTQLVSHGDLLAMNNGGSTFSLQSFDFGSYFGEVPFSVVGTLQGGGTTSAFFNPDGNTQTLETFFLGSEFVNLVEVNWQQTGGNQGLFNIDNIVVNEASAPVPEPGTMMLLGFGMASLAIYGKRRKNNKA